MALKQVEVAFRKGYDIGMGVAAASGSPMALGATGEVTPPQVATGGSGSFIFRRVETTEDLETELGISAQASGGVGLFSASGSFDFAKKCKIQSSSLAVVMSAEEHFAFQQMDSPALSPTAAELVRNGKVERFANQFGEYFVRGIDSGGRFVGVVRIDTRSQKSKQDVNAAFSANYGLTIDVDARLKISNALAAASAKVEAFVFHEGGRVTTRPTSSDPIELLNQMYKAMDEWTASVRGEAEAYNVTLAPYAIALGPDPPNIADLEHQRDVLTRCARLRSLTLDKLNLLDYILSTDHMGEFAIVKPPAGPDLAAIQAGLDRDLDVIAEAASFAIDHAGDARMPEDFMREVKHEPDFKLTVVPPDLAQHTGGNRVVPDFVGLSFNDVNTLAAATEIPIDHRFPELLFDLRASAQNFPVGAQIPPMTPVVVTFVNASLPPPE